MPALSTGATVTHCVRSRSCSATPADPIASEPDCDRARPLQIDRTGCRSQLGALGWRSERSGRARRYRARPMPPAPRARGRARIISGVQAPPSFRDLTLGAVRRAARVARPGARRRQRVGGRGGARRVARRDGRDADPGPAEVRRPRARCARPRPRPRERSSDELLDLADEDAAAYAACAIALKLPREAFADQELRDRQIRETAQVAAEVPLRCVERCVDALGIAEALAGRSNKNASSDLRVASLLLEAAADGAAANVLVNLPLIGTNEWTDATEAPGRSSCSSDARDARARDPRRSSPAARRARRSRRLPGVAGTLERRRSAARRAVGSTPRGRAVRDRDPRARRGRRGRVPRAPRPPARPRRRGLRAQRAVDGLPRADPQGLRPGRHRGLVRRRPGRRPRRPRSAS